MKSGRDNYNRLYELLLLIDLLRRSMRGLTYDDIREKFRWERKTTERMLNLLDNHFVHSFVRERDGTKKYFRLKGEDNFPPSYISEPEIVALKTALGFVKMNDPLRLPLESLAGKLEALKDDGASNIEDLTLVNGTASAPRPHIKLDRKVVEKLQEAILACNAVRIEYAKDGDVVALVLYPLGFLYGVQNDYLVAAYKGDVDKPRHYILSNVLSVKPLDKSFDAKGFNIHKYAAKSFGVWISHDGGYKVKWRVLPDAAERAKRFVFHPTQKMTAQKDGSLTIEFVADGLKEMAWHLMTWEGQIRPLAPRELIDEYKNQIKLTTGALK